MLRKKMPVYFWLNMGLLLFLQKKIPGGDSLLHNYAKWLVFWMIVGYSGLFCLLTALSNLHSVEIYVFDF
jgi:hypothetical protein